MGEPRRRLRGVIPQHRAGGPVPGYTALLQLPGEKRNGLMDLGLRDRVYVVTGEAVALVSLPPRRSSPRAPAWPSAARTSRRPPLLLPAWRRESPLPTAPAGSSPITAIVTLPGG